MPICVTTTTSNKDVSQGAVSGNYDALIAHLWLGLRHQAESYLPAPDIELIEKAYRAADRAHRPQTRNTGEPYITHPLAVARILADLRVDAETVIAGLLHDTIEDTDYKKPAIEADFGSAVAELVDGVTKMDRNEAGSKATQTAESIRKMMLAMTRDLRVILIKLADRLHNMRTISGKDRGGQRRIGLETLELYAKIAQRFGMNKIKAELQDLSFQAIHPWRHQVIAHHAEKLLVGRRQPMHAIERRFSALLDAEQVPHRILHRVKAPYSIYSKMETPRGVKPRRFNSVTDVYGFRIIVPKASQCYSVVGALHQQFQPREGTLRDFIGTPKQNGYQSLHTLLEIEPSIAVEVQIRSEDMDVLAERGLAAHWVYKAGVDSTNNHGTLKAREWVRSLLEGNQQQRDAMEFVEQVKVELFPDEVYVLTPNFKIIALPRNATALDFAYAVHTGLGDEAVMAYVDGALLPLRTRLISGQQVEIVTSKLSKPKPNWLEFVVTARARQQIRGHIKDLKHRQAVALGQRMLDRALAELGGTLETVSAELLAVVLAEQHCADLSELVAQLAVGNRSPELIARALLGTRDDGSVGAEQVIPVSGQDGDVVHFAHCCYPLPGDDITGFMSHGKGLVVHRHQCTNLQELRKNPERFVRTVWERHGDTVFKSQIRVDTQNARGVLARVAATFAEADCNIVDFRSIATDEASATLSFTAELRDVEHLALLFQKLGRLDVVISCQRAQN